MDQATRIKIKETTINKNYFWLRNNSLIINSEDISVSIREENKIKFRRNFCELERDICARERIAEGRH